MFIIDGIVKFAGLIGGSPIIRKILAFGFVLLIGFAWGNYHATQRALEEKDTADTAIFAKTTGDLAKAYTGKVKEIEHHLAEDRLKDQGADKHAAVAIAAATGSAKADYAAAVVQITKEIAQERAKEIVNVSTSCPPVEPFRFSPDTRRLLNAAAAAPPVPGPTDSGAPLPGSVRGIAPATGTRAAATGR